MKDNTEVLKALDLIDSLILTAGFLSRHFDAAEQELRNSRAELLAQIDPPHLVDERQWVIPLRAN